MEYHKRLLVGATAENDEAKEELLLLFIRDLLVPVLTHPTVARQLFVTYEQDKTALSSSYGVQCDIVDTIHHVLVDVR